jgi:hypothetical protein
METKEIAVKLWDLLDKIDTASDMFKPCESNGIKSYENFYNYAMSKSEERHKLMKSDGHDLFTIEEFNNIPKDKNGNIITEKTESELPLMKRNFS